MSPLTDAIHARALNSICGRICPILSYNVPRFSFYDETGCEEELARITELIADPRSDVNASLVHKQVCSMMTPFNTVDQPMVYRWRVRCRENMEPGNVGYYEHVTTSIGRYVVELYDWRVFEMLLSRADFDRSAFMHKVVEQAPNTVRHTFLHASTDDINQVNEKGENPIKKAIQMGNLSSFVDLLRRRDFRPNVCNIFRVLIDQILGNSCGCPTSDTDCFVCVVRRMLREMAELPADRFEQTVGGQLRCHVTDHKTVEILFKRCHRIDLHVLRFE